MNLFSARRRGLFAAAAVLALLAAACGGDDSGSATTTTPTTNQSTTVAPTSTLPPTSTIPPTTPTTQPPDTTPTTTAPTTVPPTTLPGEPIEIGPAAGDVLAVVGVAHDDVLNVRAAPGTDQDIVTTLAPTADDVVALGQARSLPQSIWYEVEVDGTTGWVSSAFVALIGLTDDTTSAIVDALGEIPTAATMTGLGQIVADESASEDPPSRITKTVDETVGDLGEVTFDVIGLGDDAVFGVRLHVFGEPTTDGFSLKSVESTVLCGRGVTDDGLCV